MGFSWLTAALFPSIFLGFGDEKGQNPPFFPVRGGVVLALVTSNALSPFVVVRSRGLQGGGNCGGDWVVQQVLRGRSLWFFGLLPSS